MPNVEENIHEVLDRVESAADRAGRSADDVELVAVSKLKTADEIVNAIQAGQLIFGENRVEEGVDKIKQLQNFASVQWHMIGHIQSRKAKAVLANFDYVHSVDREKIARKLNQIAVDSSLILPVLLQCNVSGEATKGGWPFHEEELWSSQTASLQPLFTLPGIRIEGLMTMAPFLANDIQLHEIFSRLRNVRDHLEYEYGIDLPTLSMGMTDDFEIAIQEGATLIRVGRAIFGERQP